MKAEKSSMELVEFHIFQSDYSLILPREDDDVNMNVLENLTIDIDFNINKVDENDYTVVCIITINADKKTGYSIKVTGASAFVLPENMENIERNKILYYSGVSICIANIRAYISNITSYNSIFPKYLLPTIDMTKLLQSKLKEDNSTTAELE